MQLVGIQIYNLNIARIKNNTKNFIMFITALGQHVTILIESSSGPYEDTDPYLAMFKMRCGIPNAYILDIPLYKMHVSLCSNCTIRIHISKTLKPVRMKVVTRMYLRCVVTELWILLHILLLIIKYVCKS